jgi:hypothetical protein
MLWSGTTTPVGPSDNAFIKARKAHVKTALSRIIKDTILGLSIDTLDENINNARAIGKETACTEKLTCNPLKLLLLLSAKNQAPLPHKSSVKIPKKLAVNTSFTV